MAKAAEDHVRLAQRVMSSMDAFDSARQQEAVSSGAATTLNSDEVTAGLLCGFCRAHRRLGGLDAHLVSKSIRYLSRARPEYARASDLLTAPNRNDVTSAWSDFAEAIVDATDAAEDPGGILLQFATLARKHGVVYEAGATDHELDLVADSRKSRAKPATVSHPLPIH